jgi:hypothetical protein
MRWAFLTGIFLLSLQTFAATREDEKKILHDTYRELQELAVDLPFGTVWANDEEIVRSKYRDASKQLSKAVQNWETQNALAKDALKEALLGYRTAGLLLPFYAIDKERREGVVQRYLKAEDNLFMLLGGGITPPPPPTDKDWPNRGLVWKWTGKKLAFADAVRHCDSLPPVDGKAWVVPTLNNYSPSLREMKAPAKNPVFAVEVAKAKAWSLDAGSSTGKYQMVDFQIEDTFEASESELLSVICVRSGP